MFTDPRGPSRLVLAHATEIVFAIAALAGWAALTVGICRLVPLGVGRAVWPLSLGVLLLSACGWGFLGKVVFRGLYVIWHKSRER